MYIICCNGINSFNLHYAVVTWSMRNEDSNWINCCSSRKSSNYSNCSRFSIIINSKNILKNTNALPALPLLGQRLGPSRLQGVHNNIWNDLQIFQVWYLLFIFLENSKECLELSDEYADKVPAPRPKWLGNDLCLPSHPPCSTIYITPLCFWKL